MSQIAGTQNYLNKNSWTYVTCEFKISLSREYWGIRLIN